MDSQITTDHQRRDKEQELSKLINLKKGIERMATNYEIDHTDAAAEVVAVIDHAIDKARTQLDRYRSLSSLSWIEGDWPKLPILQNASQIPACLIDGRLILRWSQKELAEKVGVTPEQICRYEKGGYTKLRLEKVIEIANLMANAFGSQQMIDARLRGAIDSAPVPTTE